MDASSALLHSPETSDLSPPPEIEIIRGATGQNFWVLREDKLAGGTKQRAAYGYVQDQKERGVRELCYASPFSGFAQVALAVCCHTLGVKCRIFAEQDQTISGSEAHPFSELAKSWGATVHIFPDLNHAERASVGYSRARPGLLKVPLGFNCPSYVRHFQREVKRIWSGIGDQLGEFPTRLWLPVGSGTLATTVRSVIPAHVRLECLNVRVLPAGDPRVERVRFLPNTEMRTVPESFAEGPGVRAPIASNRHYDAKLWRFLRTEAGAGDLWWNVAR